MDFKLIYENEILNEVKAKKTSTGANKSQVDGALEYAGNLAECIEDVERKMGELKSDR